MANMNELKDPHNVIKHRLRKHFFILLALAIFLIAVLIWVTLAVLDVTGIDALSTIV